MPIPISKPTVPLAETIKADNFRRLAGNRVSNIITAIQKLHSLANTNSYIYTDHDIEKIFKTLQEELDRAKKEFKHVPKFSL